MPISEITLHALIKKREQPKVDFKVKLELKNTFQKDEFIKDVSAIANTPGRVGYLIIGVKNNGSIIGISTIAFKEEQLQQIIAKSVDPPVVFAVYFKRIRGKTVGIIEIPTSVNRPHQVKKSHHFHIRRGTTTDFMSTQDIITTVKRTITLKNNPSSEYEQFPPTTRKNKILEDIIDVFKEIGFRYRTKTIQIGDDRRFKVLVNIFKNEKLKQQFYVYITPDSMDRYDMYEPVRNIINWWEKLPISKFLNMGLIFSTGNISDSHLNSRNYRIPETTVKKLDTKNFYYGIGDLGDVAARGMNKYSIESSIPKFFCKKIKSKDDMSERISLVQEFIKNHKSMFKIAQNLKRYQLKIR